MSSSSPSGSIHSSSGSTDTESNTFMTGSSSPTATAVNDGRQIAPLRKSLSVDSFVIYGRQTYSSGTRPNRGNTSSALEPPKNLVLYRKEQDPRLAPRNSLSPVDVVDSAAFSDSDVERSNVLTDRPLKVQEQYQQQLFNPAGDLSLPARTVAVSITSSASSIASASTCSHHNDAPPPRLQTASSLQSMAPTRVVSSGRARSGSMGNPPRRIHINTKILPRVPFSSPAQIIRLAVVGAPLSGKSLAIRKGLKGSGLSEPVTISTSSGRYVRRVGTIPKDHHSDGTLHVLEIDVPTSDPITSVGLKGFIWPEGTPHGVVLCYDVSEQTSFQTVQDLLRGYRDLKIPALVLACKSDLEKHVLPHVAVDILKQFDVGLVEVTCVDAAGKHKLRRSFDWLFKAIFRDRKFPNGEVDPSPYRNSASPDILSFPESENSRTVTPVPTSSKISTQTVSRFPTTTPLQVATRSIPNSPTRARSMGDLLSEHEKHRTRDWRSSDLNAPKQADLSHGSSESLHEGDTLENIVKEVKDKAPRPAPAQWATLEELLDKLLFLAVSGDDSAYIAHFLLTYRRFASPRSVLLAMQKRMRQLDNPSGDPMFACFAQMRICSLLEQWIRDYPYDFAVRNTAGALSALIKSIIAKTYLLHYGSEFLPFLELLPNLVDKDPVWSIKTDDSAADESDDSYSIEEEATSLVGATPFEEPIPEPLGSPMPEHNPTRTRKGSVPLAPSHPSSIAAPSHSSRTESVDASAASKHIIRDLVKLASEVLTIDPDDIAQEITRFEANMFLEIEPRAWLQYTFVSGKKDPDTDNIVKFNQVSNRLADWVVSLILCHERPKARAKQIEKFVEVAQRLRVYNNYSALRAFVAGINNSTYPGDQTMEYFKQKSPEQAKNLQSWILLLQHNRSHRNYRMALKNTKGPCIPALEVHMSDLIKAHEGNSDSNATDSSKIHWGKFNLMGRFINQTVDCQKQCRMSTDYDFPERYYIQDLLMNITLMNDELQQSRLAPPTDFEADDFRPNSSPANGKDIALLRKLFFW